MQIKAISLFLASYLIIATVAGPVPPPAEQAQDVQQPPTQASAGGLLEPATGAIAPVLEAAKGAVKGLPAVGPTAAGLLGGEAPKAS